MPTIDTIKPFLGSLHNLTGQSSDGKNDYIHPALRNLGSVSIVTIREIVAPAIFRNSEQEITSILLSSGEQVVRAVPLKFKHRERGTGLRILRRYAAGGAYPQNRNAVAEKKPLPEVFDMNSLVFGDSVNRGNQVLPVKAAVNYSDGLSLVPYLKATDTTRHIRASEDGSLFDAAAKKNSSALYDRHYVLPGTLLIQVISTVGRTLPFEGLEHLMLSIAASGTYGGQTSVSGVNVRTHVAGIYGSLVERAETSPYEIAKALMESDVDGTDLAAVIAAVDKFVSPKHEARVSHEDAESWKAGLLEELSSDAPRLRELYSSSKGHIGHLFTEWFVGSKAAPAAA
jgi:CRISPR-associated protein Csc2